MMSKPWLCTTCVKRRKCPKHFIVWLLGIARYVHSTNCYEPEWKPTYRNSSATMEYQNTMLCCGYSGELKPCKDIKGCDLCVGPDIDANGNEIYVCGLGTDTFKCKRDNLIQPFIDIAKCMCNEPKPCDDDEIEKAIKYLKDMSWEIGTVSAECLSEKAGQKMRECIDVLESRIDELEK